MHNGNNGVRRGPDLQPRSRRSDRGRRRDWARTPTYNSWAQMRSRCNSPTHPRYADWGGRGIAVCERWASFDAFLEDMGERPPGTTLERLDNDGNYEPGNCAWVSSARQGRNKRSTRLTQAKVLEIVALLPLSPSIQAIAEETGIERHTVGVVATTIAALRADHEQPPGMDRLGSRPG